MTADRIEVAIRSSQAALNDERTVIESRLGDLRMIRREMDSEHIRLTARLRQVNAALEEPQCES